MNELDKLQVDCEKVLKLLKDRQPGLITWNELLVNGCSNLTKILIEGGSLCPYCEVDEDEFLPFESI